MALFAYRAIDVDGRISTGNLDAVNAVDLELRLKRLGLDLLTFEGVKRSTAARTRSISREELITFCFHLSQLLKAGVNIIGVIAQRLLRKLCTHCKAPTAPDPGTRRLLGMSEDDARPVYQAVGCARCDNIGYRGRAALMELFKLDAEIDELIARRATGREIRSAAAAKGFRSLAEDAVSRVLLGETSLEEISRVVDLTDRVI